MYDVYISMRHTPLSMYYLGWIEKFLGTANVKLYDGFDRPRTGCFPDELSKKIRTCPNFIVILTPETFEADDDVNWMEYEIETAINSNINIIPVVSFDFVWPEELSIRVAPLLKYSTIVIKSGGYYSLAPKNFQLSIDSIIKRLIPTKREESVFISYSTKDAEIANQVRKRLEQDHITCWMAPESIPAGRNYASVIPAAIEKCDIFLLILSKNSQESNWVPIELDKAINSKRAIIPFQIDTHITQTFSFYLANRQRILVDTDFEDAYFELRESIFDILSDA